MQNSAAGKVRLYAIDIARALALAAMAVYHFSWDLEFFGYAPAGMTRELGWIFFARAIAASFLFLAGVSLVLAHGNGLRPGPFLQRLAVIVGAALLITAATYAFTPDLFIFFGILHAIALFSVIGLLFLRLPWWTTLTAAAICVALPQLYRSPVFELPILWWIGLAPAFPPSNDYVPLFPWFGSFLAGMGLAQFRHPAAIAVIASIGPGGAARQALSFAGRHSLIFYLAHQPVLISAVWLFAQFVPPQAPSPHAQFLESCQFSCTQTRDNAFCASYCACVLDRLETEGNLDNLLAGTLTAKDNGRIANFARQCEAEVETGGR